MVSAHRPADSSVEIGKVQPEEVDAAHHFTSSAMHNQHNMILVGEIAELLGHVSVFEAFGRNSNGFILSRRVHSGWAIPAGTEPIDSSRHPRHRPLLLP